MALSIVRGNCVGCGKPIEFNSFADFPDCHVRDEKPWVVSSTLHTTMLICSGCGTYNKYIASELGMDRLEEAIFDL